MSSDSKKPESPETDTGREDAAEDAAREDAPSEESAQVVVRDQDAVTPSEEGGDIDRPEPQTEEEIAAAQVGVERYVHAAFFASGILAAYLSGKLLLSLWNYLGEWPAAVRSLPFLIEYTEEERASLTLIMGAVVGVLLVLRYYRRPAVRSWATSVAGELARVTWPSKDTVTNGTIVVIVAGAVATVYIALLDRLWGYLTNLVYGA